MASHPYFDAGGKGRWRMKWWDGKKWRIETLGRHPGAWKKESPPKKVPPEIDLVARKYRDLETQARHGVDVAPVRATSLHDALQAHGKSLEVSAVKGTMAIYWRTAGKFEAHCAAAGIATFKAVRPEHCRTYLEGRAKEGRARATLNAEKGCLAPAWSLAVREGRISVNPWANVPLPIKKRQEEPPYWTREELAKLAASCHRWLRDMVILGANCGMRVTALMSLEWRDISFERGVIIARAGTSKTARRYEVPMSPTANEVLARRLIARAPDNPLVFAGPRTGGKIQINHVYRRIKKAVARAKIEDKGHYCHILRHTFAAHAVMSGVPLYIVSAWLGHRSITMTERYSHLCPSESHRQMGEKFDLPGTQPPPATSPSASGG